MTSRSRKVGKIKPNQEGLRCWIGIYIGQHLELLGTHLCLLLGARTAGALTLLGQKDSLDVGQDAALGDGHSRHELVQLFVIPG